MGTASLVIGIALIGIGVYYLLSPVSAVTQIETIWGTGYRFATEAEQGDMLIGKLIIAIPTMIVGGFFLRKFDKDRKKEKS